MTASIEKTQRDLAWKRWEMICRILNQKADRLERARRELALKVMRQAGCGHPMHLHNAFVGPRWPGVNYRLLRKARWLMERAWEPRRVASKAKERAWNRILVPFGYRAHE